MSDVKREVYCRNLKLRENSIDMLPKILRSFNKAEEVAVHNYTSHECWKWPQVASGEG